MKRHKRKQFARKKEKKQTGITLIALVITAVILLVLAGIAISLVVGKNGVVEQSNNAIVTNRKASAKEDVQMAWTSAKTKYWTEWAQNSSKNLRDYFTMSVLNPYLIGKGKITAEPSYNESRRAYLVKYTAIDQNQPYTFYVTEDGEITESNGLSISPASLAIRIKNGVAEPGKLTAELDGNSVDISWSVADGSEFVDLSSATGTEVTLTPKAEGTAKVIATYGSESVACDVNVYISKQVTIRCYGVKFGVRTKKNSTDNYGYVDVTGYTGDTAELPYPARWSDDGPTYCYGYMFTGWNDSESNGKKLYEASDRTFVIPYDIEEIYASWEVQHPWGEGKFLGEALNADKYGWMIRGYDSKIYNKGWRLYYQDKNNTYIIADTYYKNSGVPYNNYSSGEDVSSVCQDLNYFAKLSGNCFTANNTSDSMKVVAWLTDTREDSLWSQNYKDGGESPMAKWAIGAPSLDLLAASYSATHPNLSSKIGVTYERKNGAEMCYPSEAYGLGPVGEFHGIYRRGEAFQIYDFNSWYLASPEYPSNGGCWGTSGSSLICSFGNGYLYSQIARPIVCIDTDVFNENCELINDVQDYLGEARNVDKYGWKVNGYSSETGKAEGSGSYTGKWRLFYQDDEHTYIIANLTSKTYRPSDYYSEYLNGTYVSEEGQNLNCKLKPGLYFTDKDNSNNIKTLAWLTDTGNNSEWTMKYKDAGSNGIAEYAIGSPSIELFYESFKATHSTSKLKVYLGDDGYNVYYGGEDTPFKSSEYHGIYSYSNSSTWWIASPYLGKYNYFFAVSGYYSRFHDLSTCTGTSLYCRPVVSIPTSIFNSTLLSGLTDE